VDEQLNNNDAGQQKQRKPVTKWLAVLIPMFIAAFGILLYQTGHFPKYAPWLKKSENQIAPVFQKITSEDLLSSDHLLNKIGQSAGEKDIESGSQEVPLLGETDQKPAACPPESFPALLEKTPGEPSVTQETLHASSGTQTQETLVQVSGNQTHANAEDKSQVSAQSQQQGSSESVNKSQSAENITKQTVPEHNQSGEPKIAQRNGIKQETAAPSHISTLPKKPDEEKNGSDLFRLPGSLMVRIHDYEGNTLKWSLMVVVDNSPSMVKRLKAGGVGGKISIAENFISKLPSVLTPGSRLAVRDFSCAKADSEKKKQVHCLSRMIFPWAESPFNSLKEKIEQIGPAGKNNPCAAAAFTLKTDFSVSDALVPRILIITDGTQKCAYGEVLKAVEQHKEKDKIAVDVLALGMVRKNKPGYSGLVDKTEGLFMTADKSTDVDALAAKYGKSLKTRTMEKIEIRGEKSVFTVSPEEEITLTPGTYTVVLPAVLGLHPAKRSVEKIKVNSGEAGVLEVRIKKGRPITKMTKK
jgi:hypothetical protein